MSVRWYFLAEPIMEGQLVSFCVAEGNEQRHARIGNITFTLEQWSSFSRIIYAGQKVAGHLRIPIEFRDRTHTQMRKPAQH